MPKGIRYKPAPAVAPAPIEAILPVGTDGAPNESKDQPPIDNDHVAPGCELFTPEVIAANASSGPVLSEFPSLADILTASAPPPSGPMNGIANFYVPPAEDLPAYAKRIEHAAQPLAVCVITHPDAVSGTVFEGVYAGIRLINGPEMSALLSDGSTI